MSTALERNVVVNYKIGQKRASPLKVPYPITLT